MENVYPWMERGGGQNIFESEIHWRPPETNPELLGTHRESFLGNNEPPDFGPFPVTLSCVIGL